MNKVMNVHGDEKFNQNEKDRFQRMSSEVRTNWDKYVYTGCILYIYLNFVGMTFSLNIGEYQIEII